MTRRQKNRSTRADALVSRKAMQNYCRRTTWQNISTRKSQKQAIFNTYSHFNRPLEDILKETLWPNARHCRPKEGDCRPEAGGHRPKAGHCRPKPLSCPPLARLTLAIPTTPTTLTRPESNGTHLPRRQRHSPSPMPTLHYHNTKKRQRATHYYI